MPVPYCLRSGLLAAFSSLISKRARPVHELPLEALKKVEDRSRSGLLCELVDAWVATLPLVVEQPLEWEVAVLGAGPAGLAAAYAAASAGARTIVLERSVHPRYKTCGGGLIGASIAAAHQISIPAREHIRMATFTLDGKWEVTRRHPGESLLAMVRREDFDAELCRAAVDAGAVVRERCGARAIEQDGERVRVRLTDGSTVTARTLIGADGSAGISARHVGVRAAQVDLGLEVELPVPDVVQKRWHNRVLIDWGPIPGSYGWVFPKGDVLTVGVIAPRGMGEQTRRYLRRFVDRLGFASIVPVQDSGHLTRCRTSESPLRRGRVLVAGDAAGLLEPWTREGISFALRSGSMAGTVAAACAHNGWHDSGLDGYVSAVRDTLVPEMDAGRRILTAFSRRPGVFHAALATPLGWRAFVKFCRGGLVFSSVVDRLPVRAGLAVLGGREGRGADLNSGASLVGHGRASRP
jgi:geranylgeranyl reductase family protein